MATIQWLQLVYNSIKEYKCKICLTWLPLISPTLQSPALGFPPSTIALNRRSLCDYSASVEKGPEDVRWLDHICTSINSLTSVKWNHHLLVWTKLKSSGVKSIKKNGITTSWLCLRIAYAIHMQVFYAHSKINMPTSGGEQEGENIKETRKQRFVC